MTEIRKGVRGWMKGSGRANRDELAKVIRERRAFGIKTPIQDSRKPISEDEWKFVCEPNKPSSQDVIAGVPCFKCGSTVNLTFDEMNQIGVHLCKSGCEQKALEAVAMQAEDFDHEMCLHCLTINEDHDAICTMRGGHSCQKLPCRDFKHCQDGSNKEASI